MFRKILFLLMNMYFLSDIFNSFTITECKQAFPQTERPVVTYVNPKHFAYFNVTSKRRARNRAVTMEFHANLLKTIDHFTVVHLHYFELLTNQYKPTFVEFHLKMCELHTDTIVVGAKVMQALEDMIKATPPAERPTNTTKCPYPPGIYHLVNITSPSSSLYDSFPFKRGRIFCNVTMHEEMSIMLYLDLEIRNKL